MELCELTQKCGIYFLVSFYNQLLVVVLLFILHSMDKTTDNNYIFIIYIAIPCLENRRKK